MPCAETCVFIKAVNLAQEVVAANNEDVFPLRAQQQKLAELAVTQQIVEKVVAECEGQREDGTCSSEPLINSTRGLVFGLPAVEISGQPAKKVGF